MEIDIEKIKKSKSTEELLEFSIINIDKPSGPTSFNISDFVRKTLGARKTSHFGTLDPKVTGTLPVALNRACKLTGYFSGKSKTYVGIMRLHKEAELEQIQETINKKFIGKIKQMPPLKSAVKRQLREREVYEFRVLEKKGLDVLFLAKVEGGTYIRTLCVDLGKELGVEAHMLELRRTEAGIFKENDEKYPSINLYDFEKAVEEYKKGNEKLLRELLIPGEIISKIFPSVELKKELVEKVLHGRPIHKGDLFEELPKDSEKFLVFSKNNFIGIFKKFKEGEIIARSEYTFQPTKKR